MIPGIKISLKEKKMSAVKDDLIGAIQTELEAKGITETKKSVEVYLDAVLDGLLATCRAKESVRTRLGTFRWARTEARQRINPRNNTLVDVPAYNTLKFKVAKGVRVNDIPVVIPEVEATAPVEEAKPVKNQSVAKMVASRVVKKTK